MRFRKSQLTSAVVAIAAVLVFAVALLVSGGVIDALLMIVIVAVLAGMYLLRRYARAVLLYRRPSTPQQGRTEGEPVVGAPTTGRGGAAGVAVPTPSTSTARMNGYRIGREHGPVGWGSRQ